MSGAESVVIFVLVGSLFFCLLAGFFIFFVIQYQRRMHVKDAEIAAITLQQQIEIFKASSEAEEREKERIARNLHDEINPLLRFLSDDLQSHRQNFEKGKLNSGSFEKDSEVIAKAMEGIRNSCYDLVPTYLLEYGLVKALEDHFRIISGAGNVMASFHNTAGQIDSLFSKQEQVQLYRASLEIVNNILKHSACSVLFLNLSRENGIKFEFSHNGKGVTNEQIKIAGENSRGLGLKSLNARILILGATLNYEAGMELSTVTLQLGQK